MSFWISTCGRAKLYCADNLEVLPQMQHSSVDAIVTDPPYGLSDDAKVTTTGKGGKVATMNLEWDRAVPLAWFPQAAQILKPGGAVVWWTSRQACETSVAACLMEYGCNPLSSLVWVATQPHMNPRKSFGNQVEVAAFGRKAGKVLCWTGGNHRGNALYYRRVTPQERCHPTQKPTEVMRWCLEPITEPGMVVLDPFMGSGTTGVAAIGMGRHFIGVENDPGHFETAKRRIQAECEQGRLFG